MGIRPGWGWLLLPACQALLVPREVGGQEGETLSLRCWYARGYEGYNKYWCRGAARASCRKVVETAGIEVPVRNGRVSIADNRLFCVVLLTVEELSREDAGSYWCGVERAGRDIMGPVTLTVRAVPCELGITPERDNVYDNELDLRKAGDSSALSSQPLSYQPGYEHHAKVWCKSRFFSISCSYMAQTDGSEVVVTQGRVSIRDNHTALTFTVTMSDVTPGDAGQYYCGAVQILRHNQWHGTEVLISEVVAATVEASDVRTLTETTPSPTSSAEPPALSQLDITLLLLFVSVKLPVILALLCGAVLHKGRAGVC
ncbi:hypothetical protein ASZ78_009697 [Callipepla squamata]|uniref:Ig-like domain-containing protein n=3 Tax=Callipepla squamata TaxID=9009 RepID=A0A226MVQ8_CALSU|nr:hypothetical protein ASZ78_009697 [Callipepla squamata]